MLERETTEDSHMFTICCIYYHNYLILILITISQSKTTYYVQSDVMQIIH